MRAKKYYQPSQMRRDEDAVQNILSTITNEER